MALTPEQIDRLIQQADGLAPKKGSIFRALVKLTEAEVRKQDDALIQQMKEVLESLAGVKLADGSYADKDCGFTLAITAAKLRLGD